MTAAHTGFARRVGSRVKRAVLARGGRPAAAPAPASGGGLAAKDDPLVQLLLNPENYADPFPFYDAMRALGPIYVTAMKEPAAAAYDSVTTIMRDPAFGVDLRFEDPAAAMISGDSLIKVNPPRHTQLRRLVGQPFHPRLIDRLDVFVEQLCNQLLDKVEGKHEFDAVQDYSLPLAIGVIAHILGIPDDYQPRFRALGDAVAHSIDPMLTPDQLTAARLASGEISQYFTELIAERKDNPGDDLLTALAQAIDNDVRLTDAELLANAQFTLLAGYATTVGLLGSGMNILIDQPDMWRALQEDAGIVPNAVEELLRLESPVQLTDRFSLKDADVLGFEVPAGTRIICAIGAANRDPDMFPDPGRFDPWRENANKQIAFVVGNHHCLGSSLARMEGDIAFRTLLRRLPTIGRAGPPIRRPFLLVRGMNSVPVAVPQGVQPA